jgi:intein/homing endonuclease
MNDTHMWRKVNSVEEGQFYTGTVYNLEVEGDHSYIANGIGVHNCWNFAGLVVSRGRC